jgi:hypothetical protein
MSGIIGGIKGAMKKKGGATSTTNQQAYTTPGTYSWVCPAGVYSVCAVAIGGGGGGAYYTGGTGGGLSYINNYAVTPGTSYTVVVGAGGNGDGGFGGSAGGNSTVFSITGGGGGSCSGGTSGVGGSGNAGNGGNGLYSSGSGASGPGGSGAGGYGGNGSIGIAGGYGGCGAGGGGASILGSGSNGGAGATGSGSSSSGGAGAVGLAGGSGGQGANNSGVTSPSGTFGGGTGGSYGGGGGGASGWGYSSGTCRGGSGAVRIIWGAGRAFPSTNTQDMTDTSIPPVTGYVGWYTGASFVANSQWSDLSGNSNHATTLKGSPSTQIQSAGTAGNTKSITTVYGGSNDGILWPTSILPSTYTLFHVARQTSSSGRGRIFDGATGNWLSGFWGGATGCAYHEGWLTSSSTDNHGLNWFVSSDQNSLYRSAGVQRGNSGGSASSRLSILNGTYSGETSSWAVAEIIVYNRTLSLSEIQSVEAYLSNKYGL